MEKEVTQKTIALSIKTTKVTADVLRMMLRKYLEAQKQKGPKAEKLYYCALIGYIWYEGREEEKNFNTLLALINASEAREDDENFKNPVDLMFEELEAKTPDHFAVRQYKKYKLAAGDICSK